MYNVSSDSSSSYQTAPSSKSSGFGILLISSTNGAPLFTGANGSFAGTDGTTETPAEDVGTEAGTEFIGLLDGADTIEAVVDAHLIIFARAAALFACKTNSLFPQNSTNTSSSAS
ncbi:hypothetical protein LI216_07590 [Mediterraneibacter glycyrrhizinilyticus]|nr:hypothetical protein [Lachnospiraceae bacterium 210521-DFI.1.109]MCB6426936.1 hypothetical protein [Mediterraneibacter glycyrrhizinilyticus]